MGIGVLSFVIGVASGDSIGCGSGKSIGCGSVGAIGGGGGGGESKAMMGTILDVTMRIAVIMTKTSSRVFIYSPLLEC